MAKSIQDLSNTQFGVYKVLEQDATKSKETKKVYWKCQCSNCNNILSVRSDGLKRLPKSCPNCRYPNLIGQRFGQLLVLSKGKADSNGHIYWNCQCDCGKIKEISGTNLIQGYTSSCGCLHSKITSELHFKDISGQRFGKLTAIKRVDNAEDKRVKWLCQCDCGTITEVQGNNLTNGHTQSCGCTRSLGELKIREILLANQILFKTEYTFSDLPNRRFDFAIYDDTGSIKYLIEFDGIQHYKWKKTWYQTEEEFEQGKKRDLEKTEYCKNQNLILIRIPYYDLDKISMDYINNKLEEAQNEKIT